MRDFIIFYINGEKFQIRGPEVFQPLSKFLREGLHLTGTKVVCAEGDCGACTVLIGRETKERLEYKPVNACIQYLFQIDGCHILTIEGFQQEQNLHPLQTSFVENNGSQCGYCTPGIISTLVAGLAEEDTPDRQQIKALLTGNLCRCTGYDAVIESAIQAGNETRITPDKLYDEKLIVNEFNRCEKDVHIQCQTGSGGLKTLLIPQSLKQALELHKQHPEAMIISGGTDLGVLLNHKKIEPTIVISISNLPELASLRNEGGKIVVGAGVTWDQLEKKVEESVPEFVAMLELFASPQIKNTGTIGGNIINASPVGDSIPFLYVLDAELELQNTEGSRWVKINQFYLGYKKLDLKRDELLVNIRFNLPQNDEHLRLYKVSRRKHMDISTFSAAFFLKYSKDEVVQSRIALGGVGPVVIRAEKAEDYLQNQAFEFGNLHEAGKIARDNIQPLSDVRGSEHYRKQLTENIFKKFYYDLEMKLGK
ncbi:MAG: FAD-binding protein [Proteobacteria bacterium]|nr:FAD-binding protein [Pseudomonadota bacterium]